MTCEMYRNLPVYRYALFRNATTPNCLPRLTSTDQWHVVKQSLERLLVMEVYEPDCLETSLVSLRAVLAANSNISCILLDSINTFYHQVKERWAQVFCQAETRALVPDPH